MSIDTQSAAPAPPAAAPQQSISTSPTTETALQRSHKCSSCNCTKQLFYERGILFNLYANETKTYVIEYSGYECASCGHLMPFKTKETAQGAG